MTPTLEVKTVQVRRPAWLGTRTERYDETRVFFGRVLGLHGWFNFRGPDGNVCNLMQGSWAISAPVDV